MSFGSITRLVVTKNPGEEAEESQLNGLTKAGLELGTFGAGSAAIGMTTMLAFSVSRIFGPKTQEMDAIRAGCLASTIMCHPGFLVAPVVGTVVATSGAVAIAPVVAYMTWEIAPAVVFSLSMAAACQGAKLKRTLDGQNCDMDDAIRFYNTWRNEWVGGLLVARHSLARMYAEHSLSVAPGSRRLLGWRNLKSGHDGDVVEAVMCPWPTLMPDEVVFEFTALPHIEWDKQLQLRLHHGDGEELNVTRDVRRSTSRVLSLTADWPLEVNLRKGIFPGILKDLGDPCPIPAYPDLGGCLLRFIYVAT
eukprot:gnl/MRDRNA2_/MRDRNA2_178128_c0_seq1.p1 gnl/MRDRNA2_/MRDRNA2_178128_c0~~gnl/MRDRNA2_/MRDRNA2_178128_c0_seq1.p1  ORF type:complete len:327 (+),score=52.10 gnl/MRDRNA2_/MRDRNA2_178128_c0_seq1:64-981(+)